MPTSFRSYIPAFSKKLKQLNTDQLTLEPYPLSYLRSLLDNHIYYLHIYAHVLDKLPGNIHKPIEKMIVIDYGAGNGLLGLFAKHCGFGQVYLNDKSKVFIHAAAQLARELNIAIDGFIEGEWDSVAIAFNKQDKPDAIIGTDVIEHIYSLEDFFDGIRLLNPTMVTVFSTASVTANLFKTKRLMRLQYNDEFIGSNPGHAMPGDQYAGLPFIEIRKRIIYQNQPGLNEEEIEKLAIATRGLNKDDILAIVNKFIETGDLPGPLLHQTNTCDPVTGSWTERLLTMKEYTNIYKQAGFSLLVYNGFYNEWQDGFKSRMLVLLNKLIAVLGKQGEIITPFITLVGRKK